MFCIFLSPVIDKVIVVQVSPSLNMTVPSTFGPLNTAIANAITKALKKNMSYKHIGYSISIQTSTNSQIKWILNVPSATANRQPVNLYVIIHSVIHVSRHGIRRAMSPLVPCVAM